MLRYQVGYCLKLLPSMTAVRVVRALASRSGDQGFKSRSFRCDNRKGYFGGWTYPEYFVALLIPVVGFDC